MRQYIKIEAKRLIFTLPGFFSALAGSVLIIMSTIFLARNFLPEILEVTPFRIGLCVEGDGLAADYVNEYVRDMESTENLLEFQTIERAEAASALKEKKLTACIIIPERTAESIMNGSNIPVQVLMGGGTAKTEKYLQKRLLTLLTECGAVMIDVPQAETLLLYEMQAENPQKLGVTLDLFHFGLVLGRADWFRQESFNTFGGADVKEYYLTAGTVLLFLFWGLGSGSFFREQEKNLPLFLERQGICLPFQQGVKQILFFFIYLVPALILCVMTKGASAAFILACAAMLALQCGFFFTLAPTTAGGIVLNSIWGLAGFFGAGGILPAVFLPKTLTDLCSVFPGGVCMELLLRVLTGKTGADGKAVGICLFWCLFFGAGGQFIFLKKERSKKRK